ncbi:MAG: SMC-Scp complex subunit ScpB [Patescibacteria group bacterium]
MNLGQKIEALLFYKAEPLKKNKIIEWLQTDFQSLTEAVSELKVLLNNRGLILIETDDSLALGTRPELAELLAEIDKKELESNLGPAGLEVLAIVLYQGPITRAGIDYIRGVNSSSTLRQLTMRGLLEKNKNINGDNKTLVYKPTIDLLTKLGISNLNDLPDYQTIKTKMNSFKQDEGEDETKNQTYEKEN